MLVSYKEGYLIYKDTGLLSQAIRKYGLEHHAVRSQLVALPDEPQILYRLHAEGVPTPDLMAGYDWPHAESPAWVDSPAQRVVSNFLVKHPRGFLLSDPRTGKTISTLWAIDWLLQVNPGWKALVLAPKSTLNDVWGVEVARHLAGRRTVKVLHHHPQWRLRDLRASTADIIVTNFDSVQLGATIGRDKRGRLVLETEENTLSNELFNRDDIQIVAIDEATFYKNLAAKRTWIIRKFIQSRVYVWAITGTPNPNSPLDAWSLAKLIRGNDYLETKTTFRQKTMVEVREHQWETLPGAEAHCVRALQPNIRYAYGDVFEADKQEFLYVSCEETMGQRQARNLLASQAAVEYEAGLLTAANAGAAHSKFLQIAAGGAYLTGDEVQYYDCSAKLHELFELIEARPKSLVYLPFTFCYALVQAEAIRRGLNFEMVYARHSPAARQACFDRFRMDPAKRFLAADPRLMSHGVNLSAADTVIWWGPTQQPETFTQANRRVVKPGAHTFIYALYVTPREKEAYNRQQHKKSFQELVLDEIQAFKHGE